MTDPVALLQELIRCKSVTPEEGGALNYLEKLLAAHGFTCHRLKFSDQDTPDVDNLYARRGTAAPHLCFAGHTDVVPVGDAAAWRHAPFGGEIADGHVFGRGACDMKGSIAAFVAAALEFLKQHQPAGSLSFLLTGDEEGPAINGTRKVLEWLAARGEKIDFCIVGEPTSRETLGDMVKIGRRGTLTGKIAVQGVQGHVAYPHLADNPIPKLLTLLKTLDDMELDKGTAHFQPSNLEIVNIDIGNSADNVIPAAARATFNVRFNDQYSGASLEKKLRAALDSVGIPYQLKVKAGGESFYTPPGKYSELLQSAIKKVAGLTAELSTTGGTSDARFIKQYCPVIEFGIVGKTAHKTDECVAVKDVAALTEIYREILKAYYAGA
ncbi:MAG: succinyl-diaminopimelate desuccinylase [Alphaproteobacteria bacterium]|nr:succinyl-diaminopimelate desuccinylase [Alphaproteobacteria bacterium]